LRTCPTPTPRRSTTTPTRATLLKDDKVSGLDIVASGAHLIRLVLNKRSALLKAFISLGDLVNA
jgi:hypothetical protein